MAGEAAGVAVLAAIGGLAILAYAAHELYVVSSNDAPLEISAADYLSQQPDATWLNLTGCELDPSELFYKQDRQGGISEVFIPVHPAGTLARGGPAAIHILAARPPTSAERLSLTFGIGAGSSDQTSVRGLLRFGLHSGSSDRREVRKLDDRVAADVVVIDEGQRPDSTFALTLLILGFGTLGIAAVAFSKSRAPPETSLRRRRGATRTGARRTKADAERPRARSRDRGRARRGGSDRGGRRRRR